MIMRNKARLVIKSSTHGASMVEYGFIVGMVVLAAIATVLIFGQNVVTYFTGASDAMEQVNENPEGFTLEGENVTYVFAPVDPVGRGYPEDIYEHRVGHEDTDFLLGTPYADMLQLTSAHIGVYGLAGPDDIRGTSADEIFIGNEGTDIIRGGGGSDTYSYSLGDGDDYIYETGGSNDVLNMPFIAYDDFSGVRTGNAFGMVMADGSTVSIMNAFQNFEYDPHFETTVFSDRTLTSSKAFRDMMMDKQKSSGFVYGTKADEDFVHTAATDGEYRIIDNHYLASVPQMGTLTITDQSIDQMTFSHNSDADLIIRMSNGDQIVVEDQNAVNDYEGIEYLVAQGSGSDESFDRTAIRSKAVDDMKSTGYVQATRNPEYIFHDMDVDGSYTLRNNHYLAGPLEMFEIINADPSEVEFFFTGSNSQTAFRMIFDDGDVVTIEDGFNRYDPYQGILGVYFADTGESFDVDAIITKVQNDQRGKGYVRGLDGPETFKYLHSDVNLTYYAGYDSSSRPDTLDMTDYDYNQTSFGYSYSESRMTLQTGQELRIPGQFGNSNEGFEIIIFGDGAGGTVTYDKAEFATLSGK